VGVYILKDGRYEYVNPAFAEIFGYSVAEILDLRSVEALVHEEDKSIVSENMRLRLSHEVESIRYDVRGYRKDGTMVSAEAFGSRIPYQGGNAIIGMLVDNTERKAREAELRDANKKIGELKLMALRSVMSPHFVFNVLNSIQFYIAKNDRLNAINYLSRFSKLMRSVLNHSVSNKIRLSEEVELLRNYIELEQTRFENKFEYAIDIDASLSADDIEIPSLLIQPYVENAILHGLYSKVDAGELKIRIFERDDIIMF
jgi:PAS domain S-box-containing protein